MNMHYLSYHFPLQRKYNRIFKRTFDIVFASIVLLLIYPWAYILIGCCIKIKMPGKIIFSQKRNGQYGKVFVCYKFRSMLPNGESDTQHIMTIPASLHSDIFYAPPALMNYPSFGTCLLEICR